MGKERFLERRKTKLYPRGDGPFQVLEKINDNAYKIDLPGEYNVSSTFNVSDLSLFDAGEDSRTNLFKEGGNDALHTSNDPFQLSQGPITRSKAKRLNEALFAFMKDLDVFKEEDITKPTFENFKFKNNYLAAQDKVFLIWEVSPN